MEKHLRGDTCGCTVTPVGGGIEWPYADLFIIHEKVLDIHTHTW
jgi:hypothetical protein